ncbi:MAG: ribulose-phosphate 3-epimerase [Bacilli bacterium]|nr:ribulose-phosphate 3-epimerase [Bacilli bacterium]
MEKNIIIAPSLLACPKNDTQNQLSLVQQFGAQWLHFDVMDGIFVKNTSFTADYLKTISSMHRMINDVHLMVEAPEAYIDQFVECGANNITFHYESYYDDNARNYLIEQIKAKGCKVGMSIKPYTPISVLFPFLKDLDMVLIMSVEPGKGGQTFLPDSYVKIRKLKNYLVQNNIDNVLIAVDGGINQETGPECVECGADVLIAGSYIFNQPNIGERINILKGIRR